jgi:hypothetical protein
MDEYTFNLLWVLVICELPVTIALLELGFVAAGYMRDPDSRWDLPAWTLRDLFKLSYGLTGELADGPSWKYLAVAAVGLAVWNLFPVWAFVRNVSPTFRPIVVGYVLVVACWFGYMARSIVWSTRGGREQGQAPSAPASRKPAHAPRDGRPRAGRRRRG